MVGWVYSAFAQTDTICTHITGYVLERPEIQASAIQAETKDEPAIAQQESIIESSYSQTNADPQTSYEIRVKEAEQASDTQYTITENI